MLNTKEMLLNLREALFSKSRKGNLSLLLKEIVKDELHIADSSQDYDNYEKLIDEKINSIKIKLQTENIPNVKINFITDEYVEITVLGNLAQIRKEIMLLNGEEFENLCETILKTHISNNIRKTQKHSIEDQHCVDLVGELTVIDDIPAHSKLYAQVKNVSSEVSLNNLKEFIGGVKLIMSDNGKTDGYMHPYILLYISASGFHHEAINYMNKIGIIYIDGYQLSQLIEKHNIDFKSFGNKAT